MIYGYKYKSYKIEKFHEGIMFFFKYLLDKEPAAFDRNKMFDVVFEPLMEISKKKFDPLLEELVLEYNKLDTTKKRKVKLAFKNNNQIEKLCDGKLTPIKYDDFKSDFSDGLKSFFEKLWNEYPHNQKIERQCGTVKKHFDAFVHTDHQIAMICPFCGISELKPTEDNYRNAYDHYLPKSIYPFTSMNFKNLAPTCHDCNSDEKSDDEVIFKNGKRRRVFFPFDTTLKANNIKVKISTQSKYDPVTKSTRLGKINWNYEVTISGKKDKRIDAWEDIYRMQGRYKKRMSNMEKQWFDEIISDYKESLEDSVSFNKFVFRRLAKLKKIITYTEKGLMRVSYEEFLFSQSRIEQKLKFFYQIK